ncbi:MAG TPA: D-alanyl-D-alanine carboxypeptidase/D-alanyl-D-alanine-endopeptidase [Propionibacteriaceae bacterium]
MRLNSVVRSRYVLAPVILLVVAGVVAGILTGTWSSLARSSLYATGLWTDGGASTLPPGAFTTPVTPHPSTPTRTPEPEPQGAPPAVLSPAKAGPAPRPGRVKTKVERVGRVSGSVSGSVIDGGSGQVLYGKNATKGYIPASTIKILTSAAALSILSPQHRFSTRVVSSGKKRITLVGGGDPYLMKKRSASEPGRATLADLARATAARLDQQGVDQVKLGYDASLFSGPAWHPDWPTSYGDQVTRISALWVNEGRVGGGVGGRVSNPARAAANEFASALRARGVRVSSVTSEVAGKNAPQLAAVKSLPLDRIVERVLMVSDNDASEVLLRQAAVGAGQPGSFAAGRKAVQSRLVKLGAWDSGAVIRDGSGLSRKNRIPAHTTAQVLRLALQPAHPELRGVVTALPVAGVEGSLRNRFYVRGATAGRGLVRAKTGTLNQVSALAGYVRSGDGSLLVYAFTVNKATDYSGTRAWLDRVLSALSTCGCR